MNDLVPIVVLHTQQQKHFSCHCRPLYSIFFVPVCEKRYKIAILYVSDDQLLTMPSLYIGHAISLLHKIMEIIYLHGISLHSRHTLSQMQHRNNLHNKPSRSLIRKVCRPGILCICYTGSMPRANVCLCMTDPEIAINHKLG